MLKLCLYINLQSSSVLAAILVLAGVASLLLIAFAVRQMRQWRHLKQDLVQLDRVHRSKVETEFILKAMRLATWRLDTKTGVFNFEYDFREGKDNFSNVENMPLFQTVQLLDKQYTSKVEQSLRALMDGTSDSYHEIYRVHTSPSNSYWEESYAIVSERDEEGNPTQIVGASQRIDSRKEMEDMLRDALSKAEESDRLKSAFLANMSHEIRTPLNAIVGFADLLPDVQGDEDRLQLIREIQANNNKLLDIMGGLISMSEIEAGRVRVQRQTFDLVSLLKKEKEREQPTTAVPINVQTPVASFIMESDEALLESILKQLLQNAIKFTTEGHIDLTLQLSDSAVRILVSDTGIGIAESDLERIFERFVKLDDYVPGTGLGLPVARTYATKLGGSVTVTSRRGEGSTFIVQLPI